MLEHGAMSRRSSGLWQTKAAPPPSFRSIDTVSRSGPSRAGPDLRVEPVETAAVRAHRTDPDSSHDRRPPPVHRAETPNSNSSFLEFRLRIARQRTSSNPKRSNIAA